MKKQFLIRLTIALPILFMMAITQNILCTAKLEQIKISQKIEQEENELQQALTKVRDLITRSSRPDESSAKLERADLDEIRRCIATIKKCLGEIDHEKSWNKLINAIACAHIATSKTPENFADAKALEAEALIELLERVGCPDDCSQNMVLGNLCILKELMEEILLSVSVIREDLTDCIAADIDTILDKTCDIQKTLCPIPVFVDEILEKLCFIEDKIIQTLADDTRTILTKDCSLLETLDEEFNKLGSKVDDTESKLCDIDSKIDDFEIVVDIALDDDFSNICSKIEDLHSKVDTGNCNPTFITAADFIIEESGHYVVGADLTSSGTVITINVSDVVLDLCGHELSGQSGTGILVEKDKANIIIQNGLLTNFDNGLIVKDGCSNITIDTIDITQSELSGIQFLGASDNKITNSEIKNCLIKECVTSAGINSALLLNYCIGVHVTNCRVNNNGYSSLANISIILLNNSSKCEIKDTEAQCNEGGQYGVDVFVLKESCENLLERCSAINNIGPDSDGFFLKSNSTNNIIKNCISIKNDFGFTYQDSPQNISSDCIAKNNDQTGFSIIQNSPRNQFIRCISASNKSHGFDTQSASNNNCEFKDCQALNNTTDGFSDGEASTLYIRNISCGNNPNYSITTTVGGNISSPGGAIGVDNVDCDLTGNDRLDLLESKLESLIDICL